MSLSLSVLAREYDWLWDHRHGRSIVDIAADVDRSVEHVRRAIERARDFTARFEPRRRSAVDYKLDLVPLFPIGPFTPTSRCPHRGAIPPAPFVCMVCHRSYLDAGPLLRIAEPAPPPIRMKA
jgi:hypothetical protein